MSTIKNTDASDSHDIKIVLSDVDGTLLNSAHEVSARTAEVVGRTVASGVPFVLASGRYPDALYPVQRALGIRGPLVTCSGALVLDAQGEPLLSRTIPLSRAVELRRTIARELPEVGVGAYGMHVWAVDDRGDARIAREERIVGACAVEQPMEEAFAGTGELHKLLLFGEPAQIDHACATLRELAPDLTVVPSSPILCEVMAADVSKAEGVSVICGHYGLDLAQAVVFGDSYNDIDMLEAVPRGYAMHGSPDEVQVAAGRVTEFDNDHDGLARQLERARGAPIPLGLIA